ncbi:transcription elongation factor SPT6 [Coniella lustricola]|uniref:Transcription elongation factor Spt6 n=1 Tax=Coniella lustricola TaxID=2025994 RepID=A0A2T3AB87_9PEZI|nr:transcription elongation factor SPT6 [Coniella lustricola]
MSSSMRDLIDDRAELDDEEDDESFAGDEDGEEAPRRRPRDPELDDSSEEEDDDDDEEEARKIREGFIVDEDEEDDEDSEARDRRRRKKRRRAEREQEEVLDDEDLDLIGEANPDFERREQTQSQFKRLKRGHGDDARQRKRGGLDDMFSEDDEEAADDRHYARPSHTRAAADEFDDFIEEDYDDEDERLRQQEDMEVARGRDRLAVGSVIDATGLDKETLEDMEAIFGNGEDYEWALYKEEDDDAGKDDQPLELKDVFEPSQLSEKLLTEADNDIRVTDEPERFQLDRRPFKKSQVTPDLKEETKWIANQMWEARKFAMESSLEGPFSKAVNKVLEFFVVDYVEVPYVFQHRKDYLIHARKMRNPHYDRRDLDSNESEFEVKAEKLLNQDDLWRIVELDIKFRGFIEKRSAVEKLVTTLRSLDIEDQMLEELVPQAREMDELQDLLDYISFKYTAQLKDATADGAAKEVKRPGARSAIFDRVRRSKAYDFFQAYGMSPEQVVTNRINAQSNVQRIVADDPSEYPIDLADSLIDGEFLSGDSVIGAARQLYAEELFTSPRLRQAMRATYFMTCVVDCRRTEKGMRKIEESHPYYEVKYLRNQSLADLAQRPEIFLKMLKAEEEGLLEVRISLRDVSRFRKQFFADFASDNYSNKADAWNSERAKVLELALSKLDKTMVKAVKDAMRTQCQESILKLCREEFSKRLDQAPYKPKGMVLGTAARVLAFSNGMADPGREKISYAWVEEDGRVIESGQLGNLARDEAAREQFTDLVNRRQPDVIAVSGFCSDSNKLVKDLENLVSEKGIMGPSYDDPETSELRTDLLEVLVVNDEVARLYKDSPRAKAEHPTLTPLVRYCVALAKYLQDPLKEYAALGRDVVSLLFHPCQSLLPEDKLRKYLETAMVDLVNLCGVDINEAVSNPYVANLLPFVSGLGPRKAQAVIKGINLNGGSVIRRDELVGDPDNNKLPVVGVKVWDNCASFLFIEYDSTNPQTEPLDNTRVHPEDYELGRKMAADALELDEEDVKAETDENGPGAVVRKLFRDDEQDKVNELVLEEYAEQLEQQYSQRKRATLETIRAELQAPYEELRRPFMPLSSEEIFLMFTGETRDSLTEHMIIPVNVRVVKDDFAIVRLDCGIEGRIEAEDVSYRSSSVKDVLSVGQTVQAKVLHVDRKGFTAKLSVREDALRIPFKKRLDYDDRNWDYDLERHDREDLKEKDSTTGRTQRVINHPLFKPFNSTQAEEYLGSQASGEVIIRPSSKGNDHLAITWKVADSVYQHVDVLELQKENEFSVGRLLRVGKFNYTDLDELIVDHVKAMARKVAEMMQHEKFHKGSRNELERWLTTYMDANPNRSSYAFCIDNKHAGYFWLCFKANRSSRVLAWPVRVVPNGYEFLKAQYPDMKALTNGFKIRYQAEISRMQNVNGR